MGYFETLADAERWVAAIRDRYPEAFASSAPATHVPAPDSAAPAPAPAGHESLSDTQVLNMLETRHVVPGQEDAGKNHSEIALLRPEDTSTRHALKEAVVQGAPVSFAVQLMWSPQPIDLTRVPSLAAFKAHTIYATEKRRQGRSSYFLRLGFFADPMSAKEVAAQSRSSFLSAAVVPVAEEEVARARTAAASTSSIPYLVHQGEDRTPDSSATSTWPTESKPVKPVTRKVSRGPETLAQTLKRLAERELWTDPDSLSESGVRHLKVDVQEQTPGRSHKD